MTALSAFGDALAILLQLEGGRVDDPRDPGGRTNEGITQRTFDAWRKAHNQPTADVYGIGSAEVAAIYRNSYGDAIRFDDLPPGVGLCVFDDAVNSGAHEAICELQRCVEVAADGVIGDVTLAAARKMAPVVLIGRLCDARLGFMRRLRTWTVFGRGWSARVETVRGKALVIARATPISKLPTAPQQVPLPSCARPDCPIRAKAA